LDYFVFCDFFILIRIGSFDQTLQAAFAVFLFGQLAIFVFVETHHTRDGLFGTTSLTRAASLLWATSFTRLFLRRLQKSNPS
jgi:hypothetical protein